MASNVETVVFRGVKFRRYPDAPGWAERAYFVPGIADRQRGVKRLHEEIWMASTGRRIPEGYHVHHKDHDTLNNDPGNLDCITEDEHRTHHVDDFLAWGLSEAGRAHLDRIRPAAAEWHRSAEGREWHREHGRQTWEAREPVEQVCQQCGGSYETLSRHGAERFCSNACRSAWRRAAGLDDVDRACERCGEPFRVNRYARTRFCSRTCGARHRRAREAAARAGLESDGR